MWWLLDCLWPHNGQGGSVWTSSAALVPVYSMHVLKNGRDHFLYYYTLVPLSQKHAIPILILISIQPFTLEISISVCAWVAHLVPAPIYLHLPMQAYMYLF